MTLSSKFWSRVHVVNRSLPSFHGKSIKMALTVTLSDDVIVIAVLEKGVGCAHFIVTTYRNLLKGNNQQLCRSFSHWTIVQKNRLFSKIVCSIVRSVKKLSFFQIFCITRSFSKKTIVVSSSFKPFLNCSFL